MADASFNKMCSAAYDFIKQLPDEDTEDMLVPQNMPSPIEVINNFNVLQHCSRPTFIPTINKLIFANVESMNPNDVSKTTFILVHAVQILLFSPTNFVLDREYSRDRQAYPHRFPTPAGIGGDLKVFEDFTLEDVNRSIIAFFYLVARREGRGNSLTCREPAKASEPFVGYADASYKPGKVPLEGTDLAVSIHTQAVLAVDAEQSLARRRQAKTRKATLDEPEQLADDGHLLHPPPSETEPEQITGLDAIDLHTDAMEAVGSTNLKKTLKKQFAAKSASEMAPMSHEDMEKLIHALVCRHGYDDPDEVLARVSKQVTHNPRISNGCLKEFIERQQESETYQMHASKYPSDIDGLILKMQKGFNLEMRMNVIQPKQNPDLDVLCDKYGMAKYPKVSFFPDSENVQPLKPHQLVDADDLVNRSISPLRHCFLASDMGTGKTRIYLSAIEMAVRLKEQAMQKGETQEFKPVLILTPVNSITQTYLEAKKEFPSLRPKIYYGSEGSFYYKRAEVLSTRKLNALLQRCLAQKAEPHVGRIIIISTYPTFCSRILQRMDEPFVWKEGFGPKKKTKVNESEEANDTDQHDGPRPTVFRRKRKTPKYMQHTVNRAEIDLLKNDDPRKADGRLVAYWLDSAVQSHSFSWLIADDAHCCRNSSSSYCNMIRLLQWDTLMCMDWVPKFNDFPKAALMYESDYDPYQKVWTKSNAEEEAQKVMGIFHKDYLEEHPELVPMEEAFRKDSNIRLWYLSPTLYQIAGQQLHWGVNHAVQVIRPIFEKMQIRRTMRSEGYFPPTVCVEEVAFDEYGPLAKAVAADGVASSKSLFNFSQARGIVLDAQASRDIPGSSNEARLNFGVHRKAVMTAFDWRNQKILNHPVFHGHKDEISRRLRNFGTAPIVGVEHVEHLLQTDTNGGINYYYSQCQEDPAFLAPADRALFVRWMADQSPILTRALDLAHKYVNIDNERLLLYVDTPWLQAVTCAFFTLAGFNVATVRSSNNQAERTRIIEEWNRDSDLEIFVANINTMVTGVNMHRRCSKGAFLTWHLNAKTMLQTISRLVRIGQTKAVKFHLLKVKNSYYDNVERLCTQKWAAQLSAEIDLPDWLQDDIRECCVFETIKTAWNQPFNRYVWVVARLVDGHDLDYHSEKCIAIGHLMSLAARLMMALRPDDEQFWKEQKGFLFNGLVKIATTLSGADIESHLEQTEDWLHENVFPIFKATFESLDKEEVASKPEHKQRIEAMKDRTLVNPAEFVINPDSDDDSDDDSDSDSDKEEDGSDGGDISENGEDEDQGDAKGVAQAD
ncbi:hypothetical protein QQX98_012715 [Neonectria punicea]|uniref:Helicase ATP-binding domain-containing protein n=1 Tax=Neonectria punicea TaxID=979145 RepID=A0ABR1GI47_9HYPO